METLTELGTKHNTDKASWHKFTEVYDKCFTPIRDNPVKLLEIGIFLGASLRMWEEYFQNGIIYGIDNCTIVSSDQLRELRTKRIKPIVADQLNRDHLKQVADVIGEMDIIIDDGLHFQEHQQVSFGYLFPYLKSGGFYVIEDLCPRNHASGWGIKDTINFTDITTNILEGFKENRKIVSQYMLTSEKEYLDQHINTIDIAYINDQSITSVIIKK